LPSMVASLLPEDPSGADPGGGEAQVVALVVGGHGGVILTEQLGEAKQIKLMALEAP
jgi:hypothetical protein